MPGVRQLTDRARFRLAGTGLPVRRLVWRHYLRPDPVQPTVPLDPTLEPHLRELRERGITALPAERFLGVATHARTTYLEPLDRGEAPTGVHDLRQEPGNRFGHTLSASLSFRDPGLLELLADPDVLALVYDYLGRQPYYRNQPTLLRHDFAAGDDVYESGHFHCDGYRQISFMLLLNDLDDAATHMQYAVGTHLGPQKSKAAEHIDDADMDGHEVLDCTGRRGTLYVFDAGAGYHRGLYRPGSRREVLHANLTTGWMGYHGVRPDVGATLPLAAGTPTHVREAFRPAGPA